VRLRVSNARLGVSAMAPAMALVAPAFWFAWYAMVYGSEMHFGGFHSSAADISHAYLLSTMTLVVTLAALGALPERFQPLMNRPAWVVGAGVGASLTTWWALATVNPVPTALTGMFTGFVAMRYTTIYAQANPKSTMLAIVIAQLLSSFVCAYASSLPVVWMLVLTCLLPLLGAVCSMVDGGEMRYEQSGEGERPSPDFIRLVAAMFLLTTVMYVSRAFYPAADNGATFADILGGGGNVSLLFLRMALIALILTLPTSTDLPKLSYYLFLALVLAALPLPLLRVQSELAPALFGAVNSLKTLVLWVLLAGMAYKTGRSPLRLFGWGYAGSTMGSNVGLVIGNALVASGAGEAALAATEAALLAVMVLTCTLVVNVQVIRRLFVPDDADDDSPVDLGAGSGLPAGTHASRREGGQTAAEAGAAAPAADGDGATADGKAAGHAPGRWRQAFRRMAVDHDLSPRETDVLEQLLKGHTKKRISEELCVSYNTVRSHVRNIYSKCDAHSQQDLIDMLDGYLHDDGE
jgi:DNA-binding CsgD family transcriptional regulator